MSSCLYDKYGNIDFMGLGPLLKLIAVGYICYVAVRKNMKILAPFFLLFGLGNLFFTTRLYNQQNLNYASDSDLAKCGLLDIHNRLKILPYLEHTGIGIVSIFMFIYLIR